MTLNQYNLRFRQSAAGMLWAIVPPVATLGVALIVFHEVVGVDTGRQPYAVFALAALTPWTFFANSMMLAVPSMMSVPLMVARLSFPRAVIPLAVVGVSMIDFAVSAGFFVIFAYVMGDGLPLTTIWVPLLILIEFAFVVGIVLFASALNMFARDVRLAVPIIAQLLLFVTPVMYPLSYVPANLRRWYEANPMTGLVESFRRVLVDAKGPDVGVLLPSMVGALLALAVGYWYFSRTESRFSDVM